MAYSSQQNMIEKIYVCNAFSNFLLKYDVWISFAVRTHFIQYAKTIIANEKWNHIEQRFWNG